MGWLDSTLRPVYTGDLCYDFSGDFKHDFAAISNHPCKPLTIQIAAVVYTGDLKSPVESQQKIAGVNGPL